MQGFIRHSTFSYTIFILLWFGLWYALGDSPWWLFVLNHFGLYLFAPALLLLVLALARRQHILVALAPLVPFLFFYGAYLMPHSAAPTICPELRVLSFNILFSNRNANSIAALIQKYEPDLVALQEVQPEMMEQLKIALSAQLPYSKRAANNRFGTTAIFSRYPIRAAGSMDLGADRPATAVKINFNGRAILFLSAHLISYTPIYSPLAAAPSEIALWKQMQNAQAERLLERMRAHNGIAVLACDCNAQETADAVRIFRRESENPSRIGNAPACSTPPENLAADRRLDRIDYFFIKGNLQPQGVYLIPETAGSDHFPILGIFGIPPVSESRTQTR